MWTTHLHTPVVFYDPNDRYVIRLLLRPANDNSGFQGEDQIKSVRSRRDRRVFYGGKFDRSVDPAEIAWNWLGTTPRVCRVCRSTAACDRSLKRFVVVLFCRRCRRQPLADVHRGDGRVRRPSLRSPAQLIVRFGQSCASKRKTRMENNHHTCIADDVHEDDGILFIRVIIINPPSCPRRRPCRRRRRRRCKNETI